VSVVRKIIVVALGGNAIKQADEKGTAEEQLRNVATTCRNIVSMLRYGHRLVITHGNGPQAGNLLLQQEAAAKEVPPQPLDVVGAMTQGQIGYMFQQTLQNMLWRERLPLPVVSIVNQVQVRLDDPGFKDPTKPVGSFFTKEEAEKIGKERRGWIMKEVKPGSVEKRFRRVVPSPEPLWNIEYIAIRRMLDAGIVVVASGGGGVPVAYDAGGDLGGVAAVIDKDLAAGRLAEAVGADILLVLTDVECAKLDYGTPREKDLRKLEVSKMRKRYEEGHFASGSMGPKVLACMRFVEWGGLFAIITSLDRAVDALNGKAGTRIVPDRVAE
jgi:carbamate kinase